MFVARQGPCHHFITTLTLQACPTEEENTLAGVGAACPTQESAIASPEKKTQIGWPNWMSAARSMNGFTSASLPLANVVQSEKDTQGRVGRAYGYDLDQDSHPLGPDWEIEDDNHSDTSEKPTEPASKRARDRFEGREPGSSASNSARGVAFSNSHTGRREPSCASGTDLQDATRKDRGDTSCPATTVMMTLTQTQTQTQTDAATDSEPGPARQDHADTESGALTFDGDGVASFNWKPLMETLFRDVLPRGAFAGLKFKNIQDEWFVLFPDGKTVTARAGTVAFQCRTNGIWCFGCHNVGCGGIDCRSCRCPCHVLGRHYGLLDHPV